MANRTPPKIVPLYEHNASQVFESGLNHKQRDQVRNVYPVIFCEVWFYHKQAHAIAEQQKIAGQRTPVKEIDGTSWPAPDFRDAI